MNKTPEQIRIWEEERFVWRPFAKETLASRSRDDKEALRLANADCRRLVDGNGAEAYAEARRREREGPAVSLARRASQQYD